MEDRFSKLLRSSIRLWLLFHVLGVLLLFVGAGEHELEDLVVRSLGTLLAILCFQAARAGRGEGRRIAVLYGTFAATQIVFGIFDLANPHGLFGQMNTFLIVQYGNLAYMSLLALLCATVAIAAVAPARRAVERGFYSFMVVLILVGPTIMPYLTRPQYLYTVPDVTDFRIIDRAAGAQKDTEADAKEIAPRVELSRWDGERRAGELHGEAKVQRIAQLLPFVKGDNYIVLVQRQFYKDLATLAQVSIGLLVVYFLFNFLRNPPSPAHLEKIHIVLFVYCVFEYVHSEVLANASTFLEMTILDRGGKFVTATVVIVMIGLFVRRLRFLTRGEGTFYERKLAIDPSSISRWRDGVDDFVISRFFVNQDLKRRFLARPGGKEH